ncbi:hypothetical protein [Cupriavidus sp. L7L]|uniref:hypothetical protein n=1 Tax=Cupriavidus sp. L7L TaxID=2546443 RepID=UPI001055AD14|nr:hypothetical protein [Cupriavidus sp. L7L]TDF63974.1 hypothetical protein E1J61_19820 [Cupriavidus sp. L7L]
MRAVERLEYLTTIVAPDGMLAGSPIHQMMQQLPESDVDRLIEAGRDAILGNPVIREFERESTAAR